MNNITHIMLNLLKILSARTIFSYVPVIPSVTLKQQRQFETFSVELNITNGIKEHEQAFYYFYCELFKHCVVYQVFLLPWELFQSGNNSGKGFICNNFDMDEEAHLPIKYRGCLINWNTQPYKVLNKDGILPKGNIKDSRKLYENKGYEFLHYLILLYHPYHMEVPSTVYPSRLRQENYEPFGSYSSNFMYYYQQEAIVKSNKINLSDFIVQDTFILNMKLSAQPKLREIIKVERDFPLFTKKGQ